jgi:hypothetical protein
MPRRPALLLTLTLLALLGALAHGCEELPGLSSVCADNDDCPPGFRCQFETGLCVCATDAVCKPGEYCAPDGVCRRRMACDTNLDCPPGTYCDSTTGNCIEQGKCTQDKQCPLGQICVQTTFRCAPGCRVSGDCPLGQVCRDQECRAGLCEDKGYCPLGELCDPGSETCFSPYDHVLRPYCDTCRSATIYEPNQCGPGPNFCLVRAGDLTLPPYCGVDCSQGQECPNGYGCFSVRIVYTSDNCRSDAECASGRCSIKEGDLLGFCLCSEDRQCPQDACDEFSFECRTTRRPCTPGGNECDRPIYCIDGYCHIGYNCKPVEGLRCEDVLP